MKTRKQRSRTEDRRRNVKLKTEAEKTETHQQKRKTREATKEKLTDMEERKTLPEQVPKQLNTGFHVFRDLVLYSVPRLTIHVM